jgi:hypothetical protein
MHNGKEYIVGSVIGPHRSARFIIDAQDYDLIRDYHWHSVSNSYISADITIDGKKKQLYMHNLIMNHLTFEGKGQHLTVDHINRIGTDNRRENLRMATQTQQNLNQCKRSRTATLPMGMTTLPRHIWYVKAHGAHGDRFAIEFKTEGLLWRSTSSKTVSTQDKLEEAIQQLQAYYAAYPHLDPVSEEQERSTLQTSYVTIMRLVPPG